MLSHYSKIGRINKTGGYFWLPKNKKPSNNIELGGFPSPAPFSLTF